MSRLVLHNQTHYACATQQFVQSEQGEMIKTKEFRLLAPLLDAVRRIIKKPVAHVLKYRTIWGPRIFYDNMPIIGKTFVVALSHSLFPFPV
jgi:hypothetical protein